MRVNSDTMSMELDTLSPADVFQYPVELIWGRLPGETRSSLGSEIEDALYQIYYRRGFFYVHWAPLREIAASFVNGELRVSQPPIRRTQELAWTGAGIMAASTVIERCLDISARVARFYMGKNRAWNAGRVAPISQSKEILGELTADKSAEERVKSINGSFGWTAASSAASQLTSDVYNLIDLGENIVPTTDQAKLLRHMFGHATDADFVVVSDRSLGQFAEAMAYYYNLATWIILATSLGAACKEWPEAWQKKSNST